MLEYLVRRILIMIPTLLAISLIVFLIIELPPGDYLESYISELQAQGEEVDQKHIEFLREQYGFDKPIMTRYWEWIGLLGLATPNFLLALIMLYFANVVFGTSIGGLMDPEYIDQPWSWAKVVSVIEHLWIPVVVIGTSGTAGMIRRLRANMLDELQKQYVTTARAKGLPPLRLLLKYPLRNAINFFIADIGSLLPNIISGAELVAVVLSLPTTGPVLIAALQSQDMYLAGSFLMFLASLTVIGVLVSDILLA